MEYKRFGNKIIVRIDKDEEILEQRYCYPSPRQYTKNVPKHPY